MRLELGPNLMFFIILVILVIMVIQVILVILILNKKISS